MLSYSKKTALMQCCGKEIYLRHNICITSLLMTGRIVGFALIIRKPNVGMKKYNF